MEAAEEVISPTRSRLYLDSYLIYQKEEEGFDFGDRRESSASGDILEKESVSIEEWVDVWGETVSINLGIGNIKCENRGHNERSGMSDARIGHTEYSARHKTDISFSLCQNI